MTAIACSPVKVRVDFERDTNFTQYRTFAMLSVKTARPKAALGEQASPAVEKKIRRDVRAALEARGFRSVGPAQADFLVATYAGMRKRIDLDVYGYGYGHRLREFDIHRYKEGTIVIDFVDREKRELFWRGVASGVIAGSAEGMDKRIEEAVHKLIARYPPK